jgi:hypothetical protein
MTPAAHRGLLAASKRGKFADAVTKLGVELADAEPPRKRWLALPWRG